MRQTLAKVACIIGFFAFGADAMSQNVPLSVGMNYTQARKVLLNNGWQPFIPTGALRLACDGKSPCDNRFADREIAFRKQFRNRGWYETVMCMSSGAGLCYHQFYDINERGLVVVTGSGSYSEMPSVVKFYYEDIPSRR